ncbi:metallophosphoesterase family protein [Deinococcus radiophilus]|uniref:Nuclease SbcCD subunit D n=1 Tax=Deinococcus radiophilus TaxID=32062 RepID=A0A431VVK0_9DEIO|nr:exonuclease SbcCD subunit D [Deinococcus radiophilus]RTR27266.1 exonuclease SbcCD subunit D [Deinococcus radiophilus]
MRVLHTADFHAGRVLRGYDRTPEIHAALTEIAELAESEKVDAVLISGDLFDTANPSADAEKALFDFFLRLRSAEIPSVAIAGNHDSSARLASVTGLLGWVGVQLVAEVTPRPGDLIRSIQTKGGETLTVGALPYLSERRLVKAADLLGGEVSDWRQKYREGMEFFLGKLAAGFQPGHVNMLMLHATLDGSQPSGSEKTMQFHLDNAYTLSPENLPRAAQYVAMGHIHRPQQAGSAPLAHYPGSVIQLDFGEGGEKKQVNLVEVSPGQPARVIPIPLGSGRELRTIRVPLDQVEARLERESQKKDGALLKVLVEAPAGTATAGLKDRVLSALPSALAVELSALQEDLALPSLKREGLSLLELYERYWHEKRGELPDDQRAAFKEAHEAVQSHVEASGEEVA